ncbi:DNA-binding response regulator [Oleiphilus messinensis]|uniref:DNA-binding response regulator n=1 Tax=Oleiphilus messinensis TaxID=141451 RepID=A0A1Y0IFH4_9GAMM|nr:response regulator transcription factor [Oleiphilus messinensis]ARU58114.1 DNA-binding response regulator [Oleiphilus messinensis]
MKVLIIEDDAVLRQQLEEILVKQQYAVDSAADGEQGLYYGQEYDYDLAIIDIGLPKMTGIEVIQKLRSEQKRYPILILTARGDWTDKVDGLEAGADDYLVKPFHVEEMLARARALIRRYSGASQPQLEFGPLQLNLTEKSVMLEGKAVELTAYEYNTLEYLALNRSKVISKTELTEHLYAQDYDRDSNVIEVFVGRLRKKLSTPEYNCPIVTIRGQGYRFSPPAEESV